MSERTPERQDAGRHARRRSGWAVPGSGRDDPGLSWEGEGTEARTRAPAPPRAFPWRALAVVGAGLLLAAIGLVLARSTSGSADSAPVPGRGEESRTSASEGDCLASLPGAGTTDLDVVPCAGQHVGEVVGVVDLPDTTGPGGYPGEDAVAQRSRTACAGAFEQYVGAPPGGSDLGLVALPPDETGWRTGQRTVVCIAEGPALVGSVRDSGR